MNWENRSAIKKVLDQRRKDKFAEKATPILLTVTITSAITMAYFAVIIEKTCF